MSASREKKQRQDIGLDPKVAKAQKEAAERRRKNITYAVIAGVVAVAVAALLIWNSGVFQRGMTAATVGGDNVSVADLSYHYHVARTNYLNQLYYYYSMLGGSPALPADTDVMDQETGETYRDFYMETALDNLSTVTALYHEALDNGYTLNDVKDDVDAELQEVKDAAASSGYSYGAYLKAAYGSYITNGSLKAQVERTVLANKYYSDHAEELRTSYSQADLDAYLADNHDSLDTFEYSVFYVPAADVETKDADGNDLDEEIVEQREEEAMELAKSDAEEILLEFADGGDFDALVEDFGLTATSCQDHVTNVGGDINSSLVYHDDLMGLKEGESAVVEATSGYYAVVLHSRELATDPTRDTRHILITAETTTDDDGATVAPTDEAWAAAEEKINAVLDEFNAGDKSEDSFAALAEKYSEDSGSNTNGGLYEGVYQGEFVSEYDEWLFDSARKSGDVSGILKHDGSASSGYCGFHIAYYVGEGEPVWAITARSALASDDLDAWREELTAQYPAVTNSNADLVG